jgi:beta-lactamase class A
MLAHVMNCQKIVNETVAEVLKKFAAQKLLPEQLAITLTDLRDEEKTIFANYRGDAPTYPASVIKMFYLVAAHRQMEDGKISDTAELRRAMHDMIVDSGNESTAYVIDVLTDTTSGIELPPEELNAWHEKRNVINRYFHANGFPEINANRKTWQEGPYGRDKQAVDNFIPSRNSLTANATARLLSQIYFRRCISTARSEQMLELMRRDLVKPDYQGGEFIGAAMTAKIGSALPVSAKLWSKAGYMSTHRHDAAIIEFADGKKIVLVIFTSGHSEEKEIISEVARILIEKVQAAIIFKESHE